MSDAVILHIHHASLNGRDDAADARNDSALMFSVEADVVTVTEMGTEPQRSAWLNAARDAGYKTLTGRGGQAIATKGLKILDGGITQVIDDPAGPVKGHRDLPWLVVEIANHRVTICSTHWVDDVETGGARRDQWIRQTNAVIDRMEKAVGPQGKQVGFFTGDVNVHFDNPGPSVTPYRQMFEAGHLTMVWEELNEWPDTGPHGGTIDVIGRRGGNDYVTALRAKVYTSTMVTSDHNPISAWYKIGQGAVDDSGGGGSPGGGGYGGGGGPDDPYNPPGEGPPGEDPEITGTGHARLAGRPFRLNPTSINWTFEAKVADIATVGGKVVQVLGTKVSDLMVSGTFGKGGWEEQAEFLAWIKTVADRQTENKPPVHFKYPAYGWDIPVYIKAYTTPDGGRSVVLSNGVIAPRWDLVLFVVNSSATLEKIATDSYISRMARGIGWKQTKFNGPLGTHALSQLLGGLSLEQYLEQQYGYASTVPEGNTNYTSTGSETYPDPGGPLPSGGTPDQNRQLGRILAERIYGWVEEEWDALEELWTHESNWRTDALNSSSGAYGIPQSLPGSKMAAAGGDWKTNPETQIRWGLTYIKNRPDYGSPSVALALWWSRDPHWY